MKQHQFLIVALLLVWSSSASSGTSVMMFGEGLRSCGEWTDAHAQRGNPRDVRWAEFDDWLGGYVTATNQFSSLPGVPGIGSHYDLNALVGWVTNYCSKHPLEPVGRAAGRLVLTISGACKLQLYASTCAEP
jgi:hypothetical protein